MWINFQYYCAVLFWFVLLGVFGAIFYATVRSAQRYAQVTEDQIWQSRLAPLTMMLHWLDWLPARVMSLGYLFIGHFNNGLAEWLKFVIDPDIANKVVVTATAKAAEQVNNAVDCTLEAVCMVKLVKRNVLFFLALVAGFTLFGGLA